MHNSLFHSRIIRLLLYVLIKTNLSQKPNCFAKIIHAIIELVNQIETQQYAMECCEPMYFLNRWTRWVLFKLYGANKWLEGGGRRWVLSRLYHCVKHCFDASAIKMCFTAATVLDRFQCNYLKHVIANASYLWIVFMYGIRNMEYGSAWNFPCFVMHNHMNHWQILTQ